jgi:hypothetical protein
VGFVVILSVSSDYFLKEHLQVRLCNGEVFFCLRRGCTVKYYLEELRLQVMNVLHTVKLIFDLPLFAIPIGFRSAENLDPHMR